MTTQDGKLEPDVGCIQYTLAELVPCCHCVSARSGHLNAKPTPKREKSFRVPVPSRRQWSCRPIGKHGKWAKLESLDGRSLDEVSLCSELTTPTYASMADNRAAAELAEKGGGCRRCCEERAGRRRLLTRGR